MAIKLLIADDDALIREGLKIILSTNEDINVVQACSNGEEAYKFCLDNQVDVAILDVRMPVMNGVDAAKKIIENSKTKVMILTTFDEDQYITKAIKYGAKGYILKNTPPDKIIDTIKLVYNGHSVMQGEVLEKLMVSLEDSTEDKEPKIDTSLFTDRELDIIKCIAEGLSNKEIASQLFISEGTVKNYISSILSKTNLSHRTQIAIYYIKGNM